MCRWLASTGIVIVELCVQRAAALLAGSSRRSRLRGHNHTFSPGHRIAVATDLVCSAPVPSRTLHAGGNLFPLDHALSSQPWIVGESPMQSGRLCYACGGWLVTAQARWQRLLLLRGVARPADISLQARRKILFYPRGVAMADDKHQHGIAESGKELRHSSGGSRDPWHSVSKTGSDPRRSFWVDHGP